jgi:hypothetical protein
MSEDLKTLGLETTVDEANREQISRFYDAVQKYFEISEFVQKVLGVTSVSHNDKLTKLPIENDFTQLQSQESVTHTIGSNVDYEKYNILEEVAQQQNKFILLKSALFQSKTLKERSHELKAKSQQVMDRSIELNIKSEKLVAISRSARESRYSKLQRDVV